MWGGAKLGHGVCSEGHGLWAGQDHIEGPQSAACPQVLVAEATSIPAFLARLSPLLIHQWATAKLGDVRFGPQNPTQALWRSIEVWPLQQACLPHHNVGRTLFNTQCTALPLTSRPL